MKRDDPKMEKREERLGRDLDGDREKGESLAHQRKVLGNRAMGRTPRRGGRR